MFCTSPLSDIAKTLEIEFGFFVDSRFKFFAFASETVNGSVSKNGIITYLC